MGRSKCRARRHGKGARHDSRRSRVPGRPGPHSEFQATPSSLIIAEVVDWIVFAGVCAVTVGIGFVVGLPSWGLWVLALVVAPVLLTVYEVVAIAAWGSTLGKRFARIRVLRADTLEAPGWKRAAVRTLGLAPWSWISWHDERHVLRRAHGLHDRLAGTVVVDDRAWRSSQRSARRQERTEGAGQ